MNLTGHLMRVYVPESARRGALRELFDATAAALGVAAPATGDSADDLLEAYARFTAGQGARALRTGGDVSRMREALYASGYSIGTRLRRRLGIASTGDAMAAARAVYRILRIDFRNTRDGEVRIPRCFFSQFYTAQVCKLMSSLDQGLLAGLSGGGRLEFRKRLTEGGPWCEAFFTEVQA